MTPETLAAVILAAVIIVMVPVARWQHRRMEERYRIEAAFREFRELTEAITSAFRQIGDALHDAQPVFDSLARAFDGIKEATR